MRLLILFIIGLLLINIGLRGNFGSMIGAIIVPQNMIEV